MASPTTPTTRQVAQNIVDSISVQLGEKIPLLPKAFTRVMAKSFSGVVVLLYKYAGFIFLQMFVKYASADSVTVNGKSIIPLRELANMFGVSGRRASTQAEFEITINVKTQSGILRTGSQLINNDTGVIYITTGDVDLSNASSVSAQVRASSDQQGGDGSGVIGNMTKGAQLSFINPLANVEQITTISTVLRVAVDQETVDSYRQRILNRLQNRPQGGALADYKEWAESVAEVENAYPYSASTPGQVDVYIESSTTPDGIPTAEQLQSALQAINFDENGQSYRRPVGSFANTFPITRYTVDVRVLNIQNVSSLADVRSNIVLTVNEYFANRAPFITGLTVGVRYDIITQSEVAGLVAGIVSAAGGTFDQCILEVSGTSFTRYVLAQGQKASVGTITYV